VIVAGKQGDAYSIERFQVTAGMPPVSSGTAMGNVAFSEQNVVKVAAVSHDGEQAVFAIYTPPKESYESARFEGYWLAHFGTGELQLLLPWDKYPDQTSQRFVTFSRDGSAFLMQTDETGNDFAWYSGNSVARVKLLRHQEMKPDSDGEKMVTIDRDGSVMIWPRTLAEQERSTLFRSAEPWIAAQWSTGSRELFTLNSKGEVQVWRFLALDKLTLAKTFHVGVREVVENARLTVNHDGTVLLVNADGVGIKVFSVASGQLIYDLREDGGILLNTDGVVSMGLSTSGDRAVIAEYFEDSMYTSSYRVWEKDRKDNSDDGVDQSDLDSEETRGFRGFLRDASYRIKGVAGAGIVSFDLASSLKKETLGSLRFPATGEIARHVAERLILSASEVQVDGETLKLQLPGGAWISLTRHAEAETAVWCHPAMTRLVTPRTTEFNDVSHAVLSPDGRAIALATEDRVRAFEAESGFPITETVRLGGMVFDLQFQSGSTSLLAADATGTVTAIPVQFEWKVKPNWLNFFTEAVLGRTLDDDKKSVRLSMEAMAEQRTRFLEELSRSMDSSPIKTLLLEKYQHSKPIAH
jgi:WD40 repeat protein